MEANLAALAVLTELGEGGQASAEQQEVLAQWSSWGAVPEVFERHRPEWEVLGARVREALGPAEFNAARATTLNAHYTEPAVARAMWRGLSDAALPQGPVLEPGCGSGTFMALAPPEARMMGVELDPVTARIAALLNPQAQVRSEGFENTRFEAEGGSFVAAIGNVPFGGFALHDPIDNPQGLSIHNHFIAKSLKHLVPGGYAVLLTSSFTMDAKRSTARAQIAKYGDLVGAVRLPTAAMSRVAGTDVVTDVLVLRRRELDTAPTSPEWLNAAHPIGTTGDGEEVLVNDYWATHPEHVLGQMSVGTGIYGSGTVRVTGETDPEAVAGALGEALRGIAEAAKNDLPFAPAHTPALDPAPGLLVPDPAAAELVPGHVRAVDAGFSAWTGTSWEPVRVAKNRTGETRALLGLRDAAEKVLTSQREADAPASQREAARAELSSRYDAYAAAYGSVNRFTLSAPKPPTAVKVSRHVTAQTNFWRRGLPEDVPADERAKAEPPEQLVAEWAAEVAPAEPVRLQPHLTGVRSDPGMGLVLALENFDEDTGRAAKTAIFSRDIISHVPRRTRAQSPADAVAISLDESRSIDLDRIAGLLNVETTRARVLIGDLVFTDHTETGELIPAATYLSGDVRAKHAAVSALVSEGRADLRPNLDALAAVVPPVVALSEVTVRPGVAWIGSEDLRAFSEDVFGVTIRAEPVPDGGGWQLLDKPSKSLFDPVVQMRFGTSKRSVADLWLAALNNSAVTVSKKVELLGADGEVRDVTLTDVEATRAAREKVATITGAFGAWVHTHAARAARLETTYNAMFNAYVAPDHAAAGQALQLPGLSAAITPHPYQRAAVARVLAEPSTLLDHVVGAGKTGTMIMAAMELRRTQVAAKPWVVVPNHLVEQTAKEFATWYPTSRVMTIATGSDPQQRAAAVARSAAGDWDAVICPATVFEGIGIDPAREQTWRAEQLEELRAQQHAAVANSDDRAGSDRVKAIEKQIKTIENRYNKQRARKDTGLPFESSGCDYLFIDEAHHYKNLARVSDYRELACSPGALRATDLDFKLRALREAKAAAAEQAGLDTGTYVPAVATFATGTPVANNLSEMWVMQHYLQPEVLDELGLGSVNAWAQQFTQNITKMEIGPDGSTWRMKDRVAGVVNAPELIALADRYTDRVAREHIPAALPMLSGGQRTLLTRQPSPEVAGFIATLAERANNLDPDPSKDNLLKITHEGRMIALDPRALGMDPEPDGGRIGAVADQITLIHRQHVQTQYNDHLGRAHPTPGGLQLVFCDRSTPKGDGTFSAYETLAEELVERGMARDQIAFIHDAGDDAARDQLFARCRTGALSVLIGSTEKMGTGVNVQDRATALHHMDCPWRPADLEQREGRIIRQGNQNETVSVFNYVTEGTYDAVMWQIVARKAAFIAQTKRVGTQRTLADVEDDMTITASAASAIATGDPRIIERAELSEQVQSLQTLADAHAQQVSTSRTQARLLRGAVETEMAQLAAVEATVALIDPAAGGRTPVGEVTTSRTAAGSRIIAATVAAAGALRAGDAVPVATFNGVPFTVRMQRRPTVDGTHALEYYLHPANCPVAASHLTIQPKRWDPAGVATRVENIVGRLPAEAARLRQSISRKAATAGEHEQAATTVFDRAEELLDAQTRLDVIDTELQMGADKQTGTDGQAVVSGEDLQAIWPALDEKNRLPGHHRSELQAGDIVRGLSHAKTILHTVTLAEDGRRMGTPVDDPEASRTPIRNENVEVVARPEAGLTPAQAWAHENEQQLVRDGGRTVAGMDVVLESTTGIVAGRLTHVEGPHYSPDYRIVRTAGGNEERIEGEDTTGIWSTRERIGNAREYDPGELGRHIGQSTPGAITHSNGVVIPAGTTIALEIGRGYSGLRPMLRQPDGDYSTVEFYRLPPAEREAFTGAPADLAPEELPVHLGQVGARTVRDLREGDVVQAQDLDPKAKLAREVRITNTPSAYGTRVDVGYAPTDGGPRTTISRDAGAEVQVRSRRVAALTTIEALHLTHPDAHVGQLADMGEGTQVRVWITPPRGEPRLVTGTYVGTRPGSGPCGRENQLHILRTDDGSAIETTGALAIHLLPPAEPPVTAPSAAYTPPATTGAEPTKAGVL